MEARRDHQLPPDLAAYREAVHPRGRVLVIAPTRAACETIELALGSRIDTLLEREHGAALRDWARTGKAFGIVAGTGTGKTLGIRIIAEELLREPLVVGVVNREREATPDTPSWNVIVVTTGIARRWLADDLVTARDTIVVDEIHQTSAELELCLALGKRIGTRFIWLSATVDPAVYRRYLDSDEVLETRAFDPALKARVTVVSEEPSEFLDDRTVRRFISGRRGVAVFLPTRAEVERLGADLSARFPRLTAVFYHGGEPIRVLRPFLQGEVARPFLLAMTAAGQSALNLPGLDTVVIEDARYGNVVEGGRNVLRRMHLGANEILQMAGRVHGRVANGEVTILSDRDLDFGALRPGPPEFQLGGDAERVALTCAELGVDAGELDLPAPLDRRAYRRAVELLTRRGLVEQGRLTRYGHQVEALPVERSWGELLVHASSEELPIVAGACGVESLYRMTREERNLHGVEVAGSDHLTAYNLLAEAIRECGAVGVVHGLTRHVFDDAELAAWGERRGVLVKAIEDGALAVASIYRALDAPLPATLPHADQHLRHRFLDLLARIQPFDLVIDGETADGQDVRVAKSSLAGSWGAIAGPLRYFADRFGKIRATIEGTTVPRQLVRKYASAGPATVALVHDRHRQGLAVSRPLEYFGFDIDENREWIRGAIPDGLLDAARALLATALMTGEVDHPSRPGLDRIVARLDEYWRRSGGALRGLEAGALGARIVAQLAGVDSWESFQRTPVRLDFAALVPPDERSRLDELPASVHLLGDRVPLEYQVRRGEGVVVVWLREGQARRIHDRDLPGLDRRVVLAVRRRGEVIEADTPDALRRVVDQMIRNSPRDRDRERPVQGRSRKISRGFRGRGPRRRRG